MLGSTAPRNGTSPWWVTIRSEGPGRFTAQAVGLPDVRASAATREGACARLQEMLSAMIAAGTLAPLELPVELAEAPKANWDPNDAEMLEFMKILDDQAAEDLEQTLQEHDRECPNSCSTPTT